MYHAIHFEDSEDLARRYDTYVDFGLISNGRPDVASPELKSAYVDIPGTDGSLDYTSALNGLTYQNRKGSWEFYVLNNYGKNEQGWVTRWHDIMNSLHGKYFDRIWLEDEGKIVNGLNSIQCDWYYKGRITVNEWKSDPQYSKVVLDYVLEPYKIRDPVIIREEWLWDDLFGGKTVDPFIELKTFTVDGTKQRRIVCTGLSTELTTFSVICTSQMSMKHTGSSEEPIIFPAGETTAAFSLQAGIHRLTFRGYGDITLVKDNNRSLRSL